MTHAVARQFPMPQARLIAIGRLALAGVSLLVIYLDPLQPARDQGVAYGLLLAYLLFAVAVLAHALRRPASAMLDHVSHVVDILVIGTLMVLTVGPTSPFYVFFSFVLLSATLRWDAVGALATGAVLTALYGGMTVVYEAMRSSPADIEIGRIVVRTFYLLAATALFAYFGAIRARSRVRLERLAAWPASIPGDDGLALTLAHAADLLAARRIVVVWEERDEPALDLAETGPAGHRRERLAPGAHPQLEAHLDRTDVYRVAGEQARAGAAVRDCGLAGSVTAPFATARFRGRLFLIGAPTDGRGDRAMASIVAVRIGSDLEQLAARRETERQSALEERMRLARKLHSGVMQSVTAARLQVVLASGQVAGEVRERIEQASAMLAAEQVELRKFLDELERPAGAPADPAGTG